MSEFKQTRYYEEGSDAGGLNDDEIAEFLGSPDSTWLLKLSYLDANGWPLSVPLWYHWDGESFYVVGRKRSKWVDHLKAEPLRDLSEDLGLADAVRTTNHDGLTGRKLGDDVDGGLDVHEILLGSLVGLVIVLLGGPIARDRCHMHEALDEVEAEAATSLQRAAGCHELQLSGLTTHRRGPVVVLGTHDLDQAIEAHGPFATDSEHEEDVDSPDDGRHLIFSEWGDTVLNQSVHPISLPLYSI
jgi:hypothetical protein